MLERAFMSYEEKYLRMKRQALQMAKIIANFTGGVEHFERSSGNAICSVCGLEMFNHPYVASETLTIDCEGRWLHL
jgi:hypothetical protein